MTLRVFGGVLAVLVVVHSYAEAQVNLPNTSFTVLGQGLESCGKRSMLRQQNKADTEEAWVDGVISDQAMWRSTNSGKSVTLNTDAYGIWGWIDKYCLANPIQNIEIATAMFLLQANAFELSSP